MANNKKTGASITSEGASPVQVAASSKSAMPKDRLSELIKIVLDTAKAKGWHAELNSSDKETFKYATVSVWKLPPGAYAEVTANFDITCTEKIKLSPHVTSGRNHGVEDLLSAAWSEIEKLPWLPKKAATPEKPAIPGQFELLERIFRRFRPYVRQLQQRYADRAGIIIQDEYDLQDVAHALLRALFDDVRSEEYAPSYAGGNSRIDFLLKSEEIAVELKLTRSTLRDKQVGEELLVDIARYQSHPNCKTLVCFVYDPNGFIKNPSGLENDLSKVHDKIKVKVIVYSN
jgi:hypothetical protein